MRKTTNDYSALDKALAEAFELYAQERYFSPERQAEEREVTFSPEFEARMEKLLRRRRGRLYTMFNTTGKRVAAVIAALVVGLTATTFSVKALRESFVRFVTEVFESFTGIVFMQDEANGVAPASAFVFVKAEPAYQPAGYEIGSTTGMSEFYRVEYIKADSTCIYYSQEKISNTTAGVDTEGVIAEEVYINGYVGLLYTNKGTMNVVFCDDQYRYYITAPVSLGEDELLRIAESIKPVS